MEPVRAATEYILVTI